MQEQSYESINEHFYVDRSKKIGSGQEGVVYEGYWLPMNKIIAVKLILKQNICQDVKREISILKTLLKIDQSNIMQYYGQQQTSEGLFLFLEYCPGGSLADLILKGKISQYLTIKLFCQILKGMTQLQKKQIIHRDMKPENILLSLNYIIKIADYGFARKKACEMSKKYTPIYAAPQIIKDYKVYDEKCDVWSVGLILYEMLTGKVFFNVKNNKELNDELKKLNQSTQKVKFYTPDLDPYWQKVTEKMLEYQASERPTFNQILKQFQKEQANLTERIISKLDPQCQQSKSYANLKKLKNYLNFVKEKGDLMKILGKQFSNNKNLDFIHNQIKYILMFLSYARYIVHIRSKLNKIHQYKVKILNQQITLQSFVPQDRQMAKLIFQEGIEYKNKVDSFQNKVLIGQICNKLQKYEDRDKHQPEFFNIIEHIKEIKNHQYRVEKYYMKLYQSLMERVKIRQDQLNQLDKQTLKIYVLIRTIEQIDEQISDTNYYISDYAKKKKEDIQNSNKQKLIAKANALNSIDDS